MNSRHAEARRRIYVRSLELKLERLLTTGTFNLIVKDPLADPHWAAAFGFGRHKSCDPAVVLETFQTYHAFYRAVNSQILFLLREAPGSRREVRTAFTRSKHAVCRSGLPGHEFQRTKAPERSKFTKDLVLEVWRYPLTRRRTLPSTSSPVAEAAYCKAILIKCPFPPPDSKSDCARAPIRLLLT